MLPDNVLDNLHALFVNGVNQILKIKVVALIALIDCGEIHRVVAVVVVARGVGDNGSYPDRGKTECLDVVELFSKALEISAPRGVGIGIARLAVVPAVNIVAAVAVVEAGRHYKIDALLAHIDAVGRIYLVGVVLSPSAV